MFFTSIFFYLVNIDFALGLLNVKIWENFKILQIFTFDDWSIVLNSAVQTQSTIIAGTDKFQTIFHDFCTAFVFVSEIIKKKKKQKTLIVCKKKKKW
jgi:hypothetical protein